MNVDRGVYRVDLRRRTYAYVRPNPDWRGLPADENARNKRQLHGLSGLRDGRTRVFIDPSWRYSEEHPCPTCYGWVPRDSPCDHDKYQCPECGRRQCVLHWRYPMRTRREAVHILKSAQMATGKDCFIRPVERLRHDQVVTVWKIFTTEEDYRSYLATGHHRR
ncbi:MAG TPA: hypothetical protein VF148_03740 [Acidimicrobiia bacterium]